jgi:hypothetical protein
MAKVELWLQPLRNHKPKNGPSGRISDPVLDRQNAADADFEQSSIDIL